MSVFDERYYDFNVYVGATTVGDLGKDRDSSYDIVGGPDADKFYLDEDTGVLRFKASLFPDGATLDGDEGDDHQGTGIPADANDPDGIYHLTVKVPVFKSNGSFDGYHFTDITVKVNPQQSGPETIYQKLSVNENTTEVVDFNETGYSIVAGPDASKFDIVDGKLVFTAAPDFETPTDGGQDNKYYVNVLTPDGNTIAYQVQVKNVENHVVLDPVRVNEGTANLPFADVNTPTLGGDDADDISVDGGGYTSFALAPDYENPADANHDNVYNFEFEKNGDNDTVYHATVIVDDVQTPATTDVQVNENTTDTGVVVPVGTVLSGDDTSKFVVGNDGKVSFVTPPDFENHTDADGDGIYMFSYKDGDITRTVAVNVNDVGQTLNHEIFVNEGETDISWNVPIGTIIQNGADGSMFIADNTDGSVSFGIPPDYENPTDSDGDNTYEFSYADGEDTHNVVVNVNNLDNDNPLSWDIEHGVVIGAVDEDTNGHHHIGHVVGNISSLLNAMDADNPVSYELVGTANGRFRLDAETGDVIVNGRPLDYEDAVDFASLPASGPQYLDITVRATSGDGAEPIDKTFKVAINDVFEQEPNQNVTKGDGDDFVDTKLTSELLHHHINPKEAGTGHDTVHAGDGNDTVYTNDGNDVAHGWRGDDTIYGGNGHDRLEGEEGNDRLYGEAGDDSLLGGHGNDTMLGGDGNDWLGGGYGNDVLYGEAGNDHLYGDYGNDHLYGGAGDDYLNGQVDNDVLFGGDGNDRLDGSWGDDALYGENGNDVLVGGIGNDWLIGGAGGDHLYAEDGNDGLTAGDGNDWVSAGNGNDWMSGGKGHDWLYGGAGADWFAFNETGFGNDVIGDFQNGADGVDLRGSGATAASLTIYDYGAGVGTLAVVDGQSSIWFQGVGGGAITTDDFLLS